jgi:hypothetical protein
MQKDLFQSLNLNHLGVYFFVQANANDADQLLEKVYCELKTNLTVSRVLQSEGLQPNATIAAVND